MNRYLRNGILTCLLCTVVALSGCASDTTQSDSAEKQDVNWTFWNSGDGTENTTGTQTEDGSDTSAAQDTENGESGIAAEGNANDEIRPKECPDVAVLDELNSLYQFSDYSNAVPENSISTIWITGLDIKCKVTSVDTELFIDLIFESHLGPKAQIPEGESKKLTFPYFVALTDARGNIVAKKVHEIDMTFKSRDDYLIDKQTVTKKLTKEEILGYGGFEVLIGFQLNEDQLNYNRQAKINSGAFE